MAATPAAPSDVAPPDVEPAEAAAITNWQRPRAKIGALSRSREPDDPELIQAHVDLRAARLAEHIERVVSEAPPLSPEQIDRLAVLLQGGGADG